MSGLFALLDDIAGTAVTATAKVPAAAVDDAATPLYVTRRLVR